MGNGIDREYLKLSRNIDLITVDLLKKYDNSVYSSLDKDFHFTPKNIAKDMIDLLEQNGGIKPDNIYIDLCCKSGIFLMLIRDKLMEHLELIEKYPDKYDRMYYIMDNLIYGICPNSHTANIVRCDLYGKYSIEGNIKSVYTDREYYGIKKEKLNIEDVKNKLKEFGDMKFDAVVGNPPYNSDIYLDFVTLGKRIANQYVCMITPAKWQFKKDKNNSDFRDTVTPYISNVVMFRDSKEVFQVDENAGICYYLINKDKTCKKMVKCTCSKNSAFDCDFEEHDENQLTLYPREILSIIGKAGTLGDGFRKSMYVSNMGSGEPTLAGTLGFKRSEFTGESDTGENATGDNYVEVLSGSKVTGYRKISDLKTTLNIEKYKCTVACMLGYAAIFGNSDKVIGSPNINILKPYQVPKGSYMVMRYFDTLEECESFVSYFNTKLISLLTYLGQCGATITAEFFRFVPDPLKFDHIFTDEELYKKYNLTEYEINVVEQIIKKRK